MLHYEMLNPSTTIGLVHKQQIVDFLYENLDEHQDNKMNISKAIDHAVGGMVNNGGFVVTAKDAGDIIGAAVLCKTGMEGFMPQNVLTYLAVRNDFRRQEIGTKLMKKVLMFARGEISVQLKAYDQKQTVEFFKKFGFNEKALQLNLYN